MGAEHPQTLKMVNNLGWLYLRQGRYPESEELLLDNFEVKRRALGELHPSTVAGLENVVILYDRMGAEEHHAEFLALYVETLRRVCEGPTARTGDRIRYASLLLTAEPVEIRNPDRALPVALEAVDETQRTDAEALAVLARAYEQTGDRSRAMATAREVLDLAPEGSEVRSGMEGLLSRLTGGPLERASGTAGPAAPGAP
jgi:tetratricopeptide (TPR) repeat protein